METLNKYRYTLRIIHLLQNNKEMNMSQMRKAFKVSSSDGIRRSINALKKLNLIDKKDIKPNETRVWLTEKGKTVKPYIDNIYQIIESS